MQCKGHKAGPGGSSVVGVGAPGVTLVVLGNMGWEAFEGRADFSSMRTYSLLGKCQDRVPGLQGLCVGRG